MQFRTLRNVSIFVLMTMGLTVAEGADVLPAAQRWAVRPLVEVDLHAAAVLDLGGLAQEDRWREEEGLPYRFAEAEIVNLRPDETGSWETLPDGRSLWRLRITNPGALSLNLGFNRFYLPADAALRVYPSRDPAAGQVYDDSDNADHGELWTPVLLADDIVVELEVDPSLRWMVDLELGSIGRGYRFFGEKPSDKSGSCNIDVICDEGDGWRNEIDTVGLVQRLGVTLCSGFMINNTANDGKPLFYTGFHCGVTATAASTLVVYWNFQSPVCGQQSGGVLTDNQRGAVFLAGSQASDFTLVELDEDPSPAWNVKFAGWNRSSANPTSAVSIHHPSVDEKSISFEDDALATTSYFGEVSPGDGTHLWVKDWDLGTTEGGSSGSPLFDQDHLVVGSLHGGAAACNNDLADWYGRLSVAWTGEGSAATRLSDWLDPQGTGATTVGLYNPSGSSFSISPSEGFEAMGVAGGPFAPESAVYILSNTGSIPAPFEVSVAAAWLTASPASGSIPVGGQVEITVGFSAQANANPAGTYRADVQFINPSLGQGATNRPVVLRVVANVPRITGVVPNPFTTETQIRYTLGGPANVSAKIFDVRGRLIRDLGTMAGEQGENFYVWDGKSDRGGRAPSGVYGFVMQALGREERTSVVHIH